jgi:hypothetical protein
MGSISGAELVVLLLVPLGALLIFGPFVGIRRAAGRQKRGETSTVGIVLPSIALAIECLAAVMGMLNLWFCALAGCLALTWLYASVQANKSAARSKMPVAKGP